MTMFRGTIQSIASTFSRPHVSVAAVALFGSVLGWSASAQAEDIKLGFVDLQRAVAETEEGKRARGQLKKDFDQRQKELDEQQEEFRKIKEDLDKKRTLLSPDVLRQKEGELEARLRRVQETYLRHQQDLGQREQQAMGAIIDRMQRIVVKIASTENLTMVFDRQQAGLVFAKPHLDLTNEVIRRFNAGEAGDAAKGAPAAAKPAPAAPKKK